VLKPRQKDFRGFVDPPLFFRTRTLHPPQFLRLIGFTKPWPVGSSVFPPFRFFQYPLRVSPFFRPLVLVRDRTVFNSLEGATFWFTLPLAARFFFVLPTPSAFYWDRVRLCFLFLLCETNPSIVWDLTLPCSLCVPSRLVRGRGLQIVLRFSSRQMHCFLFCFYGTHHGLFNFPRTLCDSVFFPLPPFGVLFHLFPPFPVPSLSVFHFPSWLESRTQTFFWPLFFFVDSLPLF